MKGFIRGFDGKLSAVFEPEEVALLSHLARETAELMEEWRSGGETPADDPAMLRLLPDAYRDDAEAAAEFRRFTADGLAERKAANARAVVASLGAESTTPTTVRLDESTVQSWLRVLTDIRLVLATRLGIEHDGDLGYADSDAAILLGDIYDWLGSVQGSMLAALPASPGHSSLHS
ncbi:MAG: hypothetical protein QOF36_2095 [Microbacteriaceae bacterium]|nr:hypothetical protein [Microbacteriaceae bacterium]